jgi:hypothetical protein
MSHRTNSPFRLNFKKNPKKTKQKLQVGEASDAGKEGVYKARVRRVFGLFWPIFDFKA